ncbi:hypothetical protein CEP54_013789 [Fusarium duplospermum]|uniref:Uncharacterized protein n=1 Tax=Fusarium duplospermum TaxID=1325734 RepID=A0A428P0N0_9HYPO|nr:hypothetical protein CEP54_013789 [Fusarium duplospermum]
MTTRAMSTGKSKFLTYRIDEIPSKYSTAEQLMQCFHSDDKVNVHVKSFVFSISDPEGREHTATVEYRASGTPRLDADAEDIELDQDFRGFTPLNSPSEHVAAEFISIIAVTGLGGHAFGSWVNSRGHMWLRDYLPKDLQDRARILIYGYPSTLRNSHSQSSLGDYSACFMQDLMGIRSQHGIQNRPIIFIGHSLGGLIVKKALSDLKPDVFSRLPVRAVLFFGAPHAGLNNTALRTMVAGQSTENLVRDLGPNSSALENLADSFERIACSIKIYSFVETHETPVVTEIDGTWQRGTRREMMVSKASAKLRCVTETVRNVNADHSQMVKLRKGQGSDYPYIVSIIKEALQSAPEKWQDSKPRGEGEPGEPMPGPSSLGAEENRQLDQCWKQSVAESQAASAPENGPKPEVQSEDEAHQSSDDAESEEDETESELEYFPHPNLNQDQSTANDPASLQRLQQLRAQLAEATSTGNNIYDPAVQQVMFRLALSLFLLGGKEYLVEAEEIIRELLDHHETVSGPCHAMTLVYLEPLSDILEKQNKHHDAENFLSHLVSRSSTAYGATAEAVLKNVAKLAEFRLRQRKYGEAEALCRPLLEQRLECFGPSHRRTVDCQILLAKCLQGLGSWAEAKFRLEESLGHLTRMLQDDGSELVGPTQMLSKALGKIGEHQKSEVSCRRVLYLMDRNSYQAQFPLSYQEGRKMLALALGDQGKHEEALRILDEVIRAVDGHEFSILEQFGLSLPRLLCSLGQQQSQMTASLAAAEETLTKAMNLLEALSVEDYESMEDGEVFVQVPRHLGQVCRELGRFGEAVQWLTKALDTCPDEQQESLQGPVLIDLALTTRAAGQLVMAVSMFQQAAEAFRSEDDLEESFDATLSVAEVYMEVRDFISAGRTLTNLLEQQKAAGLSDGDDQVLGALELYANVLEATGNSTAATGIRSRIAASCQPELQPPLVPSDVLTSGQLLGNSQDQSPGGSMMRQPGIAENLTLPTTKPLERAFQDIFDVLRSLGISSAIIQQEPTLLLLECRDQGHPFRLAASEGSDGLVLGFSPNTNNHVRSSIQRLLAPTLMGNRIVAVCIRLPDGHPSATGVVRSSEAALARHGVNTGPMEGPPSQSRHRCQVKKTRVFRSNKKTWFHVMHGILPLDHEAVMEISFEWIQGDKEVFEDAMYELVRELKVTHQDLIWDRYGQEGSDEEDYESEDDGPVYDYKVPHY